MIALPADRRVLIWSAPVDFAGAALRVRCGMDRLAALVQVTLRADPFAGDVFVFRSRRADRPPFRLPFRVGQGRVSLASASRA